MTVLISDRGGIDSMDEETKTEETQEANTEEKGKPLDNMTAIALREVQASEKVVNNHSSCPS